MKEAAQEIVTELKDKATVEYPEAAKLKSQKQSQKKRQKKRQKRNLKPLLRTQRPSNRS